MLCLAAAGFCFSPVAGTAQDSSWKKIEINGLRVFSEKTIIHECSLDRFPVKESAFKEASRRINNFYYKRGYYLAISYRVEETAEALSVFVDEGRLGQIIVKGVDDITLLRVKYDFTLAEKVYNRPSLDREIERLKKNYGFKEIRATLVEAKDYSQQFIQLDGSFQLPFFGEQRLPLFEQYGYRYNLIVEPSYYSKDEAARKQRGFTYGIRLGYPGITPKAKYTWPSCLLPEDVLQIDCSAGIPVSLPNPIKKPSISFVQTNGAYAIAPISEIFTPRIRAGAYYSGDKRPDIGLTSYNYIRTFGTLEPGVTLLSQLKVFLGAGLERVFFFREKSDPEHSRDYQNLKGSHLWKTASIHIELGRYIGLLNPLLARQADITYTYFYDSETFHRLDFSTHSDYNIRRHDIFTVALRGMFLGGIVPFYYEHAVTDDDFLGFTGRDYYTRAAMKCRMEYVTSIYRDFLFAGPYLHNIVFQGSAHNISGTQFGTAYGLTGRLVFWDQFEARIYAGKDFLYSKTKSGTDIMFILDKKF